MQAYLPPCLLFTPALLPPVHTCPPNPHSHLPTFLLFTPAHSLPVHTCPPAFCSHLPFCLLFTLAHMPPVQTFCLPLSTFISVLLLFSVSFGVQIVYCYSYIQFPPLLGLGHSHIPKLMPTETGRMLPQRFYEVSVRTKLLSHVLQFSSDCFNSFLACQETCKLCLLRQSSHSKISVLTIAEALSLLVMAR